jgi:WD40 repeat protein
MLECGTIVTSINISHDGNLIGAHITGDITGIKNGVIITQKGCIKVWEIKTGKNIFTITTESDLGLLGAIAFHPNNKFIGIGHGFGSVVFEITIWDVSTGKYIKSIQTGSCCDTPIIFSPCGKIIASGGCNGVLKLWDVITGKCLRIIKLTKP